jgi:two-component system, cell cycle sensor histidine kinase and response regulator CckA
MFAGRLGLIYGVCAALWIFFSDQALRRLVTDAQTGLILQTYKGWGFVVVTSIILFLVVRAQLRRWEGDLRKSEQRYRELMEQAADGIHLLDREGRFLLVNTAMASMLGYTPEELLKMNIVDTYPTELRPQGKKRLSEATSGKVMRFERFALRKNGTSFPVESNVMALADGTYQGITRDMTARKQEEEALVRSESLYRTIFERANVSLWEEDLGDLRVALEGLAEEGVTDFRDYFETHPDFLLAALQMIRVVDVNEATLRLYETDNKADLIGPLATVFRLDTPVTRRSWIENLVAVAEGTEYFEVESAALTCRDRPINVVVSSYIPRASEPYPYMLISVTDITARKEAEDRLRTSEESLRALLNASMDLAFLVHVDGTLLACNDAFARPFNVPPARLVGRRLSDVVGEEKRSPRLGRAREVIRSGAATRFVDERGGRTFDHSIVPIVAPSGTVSRLAWFVRDITDALRLEEQLRQAQKLESIGRLAGGIAHDFNNILQVIGGYCEVLRAELPAGPSQGNVEAIAHAAQKAAALVAQLMAFSRKQVLQPRVLDTVQLVRSTEKMLRRVMDEDVELLTALDPATGNIRAGAGQVEQVLLNLALNARDAMPGGGRLEIETTNRAIDAEYVRAHPEMKPGNYVRIVVRDTGVGMDEETISHIYEPFFTTKEPGKGTGLGLSTVYGIVKQSEGHISCSSAPGKGTTFTVYLPLVRDKPQDASMAAAAMVSPGHETILLVEDDDGVRRLARTVLERGGYTVIEATGGEEALKEVARAHIPIQLLLTDIVMPRMSGRELARRIAERFPEARVLFASGYAADHFSDEGREPGAPEVPGRTFDFIQKPFSSHELLLKVREALDRS